VSDRLRDVCRLYVSESSKVLRLLLMLASRLARAHGALATSTHDSDNHAVIISRIDPPPVRGVASGYCDELVCLSGLCAGGNAHQNWQAVTYYAVRIVVS